VTSKRWLGLLPFALVVGLFASSRELLAQSRQIGEPIRRTLTVRGAEREYFVYLPPGFDRNTTYWPLVVVGGGFLQARIVRHVGESRFDAIVIASSGPNGDVNATRFPALGEGQFIQDVLKEVRKDYRLRAKILLAGYSRGAQFAHRFALAFPGEVEAVAPLASGTWTTPEGRFLVEEIGEIKNARNFLSDASNATTIPARLHDLFNPEIAAVADSKAAAGAQNVPFLVMCGTLDPRLPIAKEFVRSLEAQGYRVAVEWPRTPHVCNRDDAACSAEFNAEFDRYSRMTVDFFQRVTRSR
jgi:pimeloyl-ACP methyl ester carboxylesterase